MAKTRFEVLSVLVNKRRLMKDLESPVDGDNLSPNFYHTDHFVFDKIFEIGNDFE